MITELINCVNCTVPFDNFTSCSAFRFSYICLGMSDPMFVTMLVNRKTSTAVDTAGVALIIDDVTLATALKHTSKLFRAVSMYVNECACA